MKKQLLTAMLIIPMSISAAFADDTSALSKDNGLSISGFGTLAYTRSNTNDAEFARPNQSNGVGKTGRTGVDSNLGLQVTKKFNDQFSVTGQTLIRKDAEDNFGAELAWAFAKYNVSDDLSFKIGRVGLPAYMISDYRNVGYANTMIRPSNEVYSQVSINSIDGVDMTYQKNVGGVAMTAQVGLGSSKSEIANNGNLQAKRLKYVSLTGEYGPVTVRLGRVEANISLLENQRLNTLFGTFNAVGLSNITNDMAVDNKKASFTSLGATLDWKNIVMQSEFAKRKTDSFIADTTSWYVMGGYRMGTVLPYMSYAKLKQDSASTVQGIPAAPQLAPLKMALEGLLTPDNQHTVTAGVRWDFQKNTALKVQVDRVFPEGGNNGLFVNAKPGFSKPTTVMAAGIDFVF